METKPTYKISIFENEAIHEIVITGEVTKDSFEKLNKEVNTIAKSINSNNLLLDVRKVKGHYGYSEEYFCVTNLPSFFYNINTAVVYITENADTQSFHNYVARIAGIPIKWFSDVDNARTWLKTKSA
jgi:hypothetical protein